MFKKYSVRLILLSVFLAMISGMYSCGNKETESNRSENRPPQYSVFTVSKRNTVIYYDYVASIQGQEDVEIRPRVDGNLSEIYIDEGQSVRKGQPLFKIEDDLLQEKVISGESELKAALAGLDKARMEIEKVTPLVEKDIVSKFELDAANSNYTAAESRVDKAKAMLNNARTTLGYSTVYSPSDGIAGMIYYKQGSLVGPSTKDPLTVISKNSQMFAYFSVTESDILDFDEDSKGRSNRENLAKLPEVKLLLPNGQMYPYSGKIDATTGLINSKTGTISLRAKFPNPELLLRSGNSGTVQIPDDRKNVILIPQKSTFEIQDKRFVYVTDNENEVKARQIFTDGTSGNFFIVEKGLEEGEKIVYEGVARLKEKMKILPVNVSSDSLFNADKENKQ